MKQKWFNLLLLTGMLVIQSCLQPKEEIPCPAIMIQPGVRLKVLDRITQQNLISKVDSFEIKNESQSLFVIPDFSDSSIFVALNGDSLETFYFRIKPATKTDTIQVYSHTFVKPDDPCKNPVYELDSLIQNGNRNNSNSIYY
ncbi:MAG: hypothetical protein WC760_04120 [Bacteroidia bacterium]|jgi:hypothetical protein